MSEIKTNPLIVSQFRPLKSVKLSRHVAGTLRKFRMLIRRTIFGANLADLTVADGIFWI